MTRSAVLLLAVLAGFRGGGYDEPIVAVGAVHEISAGTVATPAGPLRSAPAQFLTVPEHGYGPAPRTSASRSDSGAFDRWCSVPGAALRATFLTRLAEHRQFATPHALARGGLVSCPATAPPSFQII